MSACISVVSIIANSVPSLFFMMIFASPLDTLPVADNERGLLINLKIRKEFVSKSESIVFIYWTSFDAITYPVVSNLTKNKHGRIVSKKKQAQGRLLYAKYKDNEKVVAAQQAMKQGTCSLSNLGQHNTSIGGRAGAASWTSK